MKVRHRLLNLGRPAARLALAAGIALLGASPLLAAEPTAEPVVGDSYLVWVIKCSGLIGVFLFMLSIYFVAKVVSLFLELRETVAAPPALVESTTKSINDGDLRGAYQTLQASDTYLGDLLTAAMPELPHGLPEAKAALEGASEAMMLELEGSISVLAVLGTLGPMIGLLGTLKGMIASFSVIAMSGVEMKANEVAGGISESLLLTFEGVALSVPAIYFFSLFRGRASTIGMNVSLRAERMLREMHRAGSRKRDAARQASTAPAPPTAASK